MNEGAENRVSSRTDELITQWAFSVRRCSELAKQLAKATEDCKQAEFDLADYIAPGDAKEGETFNIWYLDGLLSVQVCKNDENGCRTFKVGWRTPLSPKSQIKCRM